MKKYISMIVLILTIVVLVVCLGFCISSISKKNTLANSATEKANELQAKVSELEEKLNQKGDNKNEETEKEPEKSVQALVPFYEHNETDGGRLGVRISDSAMGINLSNSRYSENQYTAVEVAVSDKDKASMAYRDITADNFLIQYDGKIADSKIYFFGNGMGNERIITLLDNGTVYQNLVRDVLKGESTPKKIEGLDNVVRVFQVNVAQKQGSGYLSVAVQKIDGTIILLVDNVDDSTLECREWYKSNK